MDNVNFPRQSAKFSFRLIILCSFILVLFSIPDAKAQAVYDPVDQTQALLYDEARTVYLGNLARRDNGVPPLRWNLKLTQAARWFSWDSTENRPSGYCGHQDTLGGWPGDRALRFGYLGGAGAENAYCGYGTPQDAINGWMNSSGHRANLLDPNSREIGLGYYRRASDGRGYVAQGFGNDAVYAPVVIENEAISTTNPDVSLYIYDRLSGGAFAGFGAANQMMVSENAHFSSAAWEPYSPNRNWTFSGNDGWRRVYVKTRDNFNRSMTVSDSIYYGSSVPLNELGVAQMSTNQSQVTINNLDGGALSMAQFSLGWLADDTFGTFQKWWGNGSSVNDATAWGGTAYRLYPGDGESFAWVYDTTFIKDVPMVAYFRLKVNDNTSTGEVARISVKGGGIEYGPLSLRGTDFASANQYQEFSINFKFNSNPDDPFLMFNFWRSGSADLYVDGVSIFTTPQPITSPLTWSVPGNNYRGQGIWIRYTNGSQFSGVSEADACVECNVSISMGGRLMGGYALLSKNVLVESYAGAQDGPVKVSSLDGSKVFTSQRVIAGDSFNEVMGFPTNQLTTDYWFPWYDNLSMITWVMVGNPSTTQTANVDIYIGGVKRGSYTIPAGGRITPRFNLQTGPVRVVSTNGVKIFTSERVDHKGSFNEVMGYPANQLTTEYWFPWYDNLSMTAWVLVSNPTGSTAKVDIYIGGVKRNSYTIPPNGRVTPRFNLQTGPVRVVSTNGVKIFTSERVVYGDSFNEVMGYPANQFTTEYWYPWYDNISMMDWVLVGNPTGSTAAVDIYIGGVKRGSFSIPAGGRITPRFNLNAGPVRVVSTNGVKIFTSQRVNYGPSFNEVMGYPGNKLTTEYWFPWYDSISMSTDILVGKP